eukprot:89704_1
MLVSGFMIPFNKVLKCQTSDTLRQALNLMTDWKVSCLVIVLEDKATGIITTTDICRCYHDGTSLDCQVGDVLLSTAGIKKIKKTVDRDTAAKFFEKNKIHHAVVVDGNGKDVGLISSLDIATEAAKDARAWPWNRQEDGKVHALVSR